MRKHCSKHKKGWLERIYSNQGIFFHIVGIIAIIWFLVRVIPKPDRMRYPCQQMSLSIAVGYITFWTILWGLIFQGVSIWIRKARTKTGAYTPLVFVSLLLIFSISSGVYADNFINEDEEIEIWQSIPNQPMGIGKGVKPGRVVWVWNPDATEKELTGFWWEKGNNNQEALNQMFSEGIKNLVGTESEKESWTDIFKYFNQERGKGDIDYQPGEKIAIKVNMNNCWERFRNEYLVKDNDRDANPYVVKALLHQLIDIVGVNQDDITVYDASRKMGNFFYNRVFYEEYPALPAIPEFPDVHFVDSTGLAIGREKVKPSSEQIHFADGLITTLPKLVVEADYIINMPLLKRHPISMGVTLSGKNFFGSWIEEVAPIHPYHESGLIMGNAAPQVDLLSHEHLGGKTLLYIGDGTFPTKDDHRTIDKFQMYPFNDDWTNSLFFSQDPVAIDSVMYDFLHTEGTNPCEGSQNYLHQSAVPLNNIYDPENDGLFLSESLGIHEHWNTTVDIFSSERYLGPEGNGIDYVPVKIEGNPQVSITNPQENHFYINGKDKFEFISTIVVGDIEVKAAVNEVVGFVNKVDFYLDGELVHSDDEAPYVWPWFKNRVAAIDLFQNFKHEIKVVANFDGNMLEDQIILWRFS